MTAPFLSMTTFSWIVALVGLILAGLIGFYIGTRRSIKLPHPVVRASQKLPTVPSASPIPDYASTLFVRPRDGKSLSYGQEFALASRRGNWHSEEGVSRQDAYAVFCRPTFTVLAVADGVSSAYESHWGSALLTKQLQAEFDRVFPNSYTSDVAAWSDLNTGLSQKLVAAYVSKMRQAGKEYPQDIEKLRGATAASYASTLEILVVDLECSPSGSKYTYVKIAGDGSLFVVSGPEVESVFDLPLSRSSDGTVFALPIHDGEPEIRTGYLASGSSLVMGTDGVSDHIKSNRSWRSALVTTLNSDQLSESALLDLVSFNVAEAGDDRTVVTVRNLY